MGHGHRRRYQEVDLSALPDEEGAGESVIDIDAAIAEELAPSGDEPVASGYYHHYPKFETDDEAETAKLNRPWNPDDPSVTRLLQPGDPDHAPPRGAGRSSGSGRKAKKKKAGPPNVQGAGKNAPDVGPGEDAEVLARRFRVYGLTTWELKFYLEDRRQNPSEEQVSGSAAARAILERVAKKMRVAPVILERTFRARHRCKTHLSIYGLSEDDVTLLRRQPGIARAVLAAHAHRFDHDRIISGDNELLKKWAQVDVVRRRKREGAETAIGDALHREVALRLRELEAEPLDKHIASLLE